MVSIRAALLIALAAACQGAPQVEFIKIAPGEFMMDAWKAR